MIEEKLMKTKMFLVTRATGGLGVFSGTNDPVKDPTGREPIDLREFVERNMTAFKIKPATRGMTLERT